MRAVLVGQPLMPLAVAVAGIAATGVAPEARGQDAWVAVAPPVARSGLGEVYDPVGHRLIVVGGQEAGAYANDTWALALGDPVRWSCLTPAGAAPPRRAMHTVVYDPNRHRLVLFGGWNGQYLGDVWVLPLAAGGAWAQIVPAGPTPGPRRQHMAIYDPARDRMIVFGGFADGMRNDVWALAFGGSPTWTQLAPAGQAPAARYDASMILDPVADRMVVFGGTTGGATNETWTLTLSGSPAWTRLTPAGTLPTKRFAHSAIYDPVRHEMVVMGGATGGIPLLGDAWSLNLAGSPTWTPHTAATGLPGRQSFAAAYDPRGDRIVVFAGFDANTPHRNDVWVLPRSAGAAWTELVPNGSPWARTRMAMIHDPVRDRIVMFGGRDVTGRDVNDLWMLPLSGTPAWTHVLPPGLQPFAKPAPAAIYDPVRDQMLIVRGTRDGIELNNLVGLALGPFPTWSFPLAAGPEVPTRNFFSLIYDAGADRLIFFGGGGFFPLNDVWEIPLGGPMSWRDLRPLGPPPSGRMLHSAIYDPIRSRMIVYGGTTSQDGCGGFADVWELSLGPAPAWAELRPVGTPPASRSGHVAIYDPASDRMIVQGGCAGGAPTHEVWALALAGTPTWSRLAVGAPGPPSRAGASAAYDLLSSRMLVYGGAGPGTELRSDVWGFEMPSIPTATVADLVVGEAAPDRVRLVWQSGHGAAVARLDRGTTEEIPAPLATLRVDGEGRSTYVDRAVTAGTRYRYQLVVGTGPEERTSREHWIQVPDAPGFGLEGVRLDPIRGRLSVDLSLASDAPARLEVLEVTGRRVAERHVAAGTPGRRTIDLDETIRLPAGIYFLRLSQAGRTAMVRAPVLR